MLRAQLRHTTACAFIIAATLAAPAAYAQDMDADAVAEPSVVEGPAEDNGMIVVTARRREERLIDVPISVTAISGEALAKQGTQTIEQLGEQVPNLTLEVSRGTNTTLSAFIRGVGQQDPVAGFEAGVGLYVDDVYLNRPQAAVLDVYDVERIEVLRGPQGTLYGRNTIGGAIKYVTARLPDQTQVKVRGTYGNYDQADVIVTASTPIGDNLRIGASGARLSRGGYGDNLVLDGVENYNKDVWAARGTMEFESGAFFARLSGDYVKDNSDPRQGHRFLPGNPAFSNAPVLDDVYDTRAGLNVVEQEVEAYGGALNMAFELSDTITLKSITGYREDKSTTPIDFDSLPVVDLDVPAIYENDQFSQELQFLYESDRLSGVLGAYYLNANALTAFDAAVWQTGQAIGLPGLTAQTFGDVNTETWSIFGDFTYELTDRLSLSLGGRYTYDKRSSRVLRTTFIGGYSDLFADGSIPIAVTSDFDDSATFKEFTPRASISFMPTPDHNLYASYSKGFKGGGFDPRGVGANAPDLDSDTVLSDDEVAKFLSFEPEEVDSYEVGYKGSLADGRVNVAIAAFYADYKNVQIPGSQACVVNTVPTFCGTVTNAGKASFKGVEFEGSARLGGGFNLSGMLGYIDAQYDEYITNIEATPTDVAQYRKVQNTPEWTGSATLAYNAPVGDGDLYAGATVSYRGKTFQFEVPNPFLDQNGYALLNGDIVYTLPGGRITIGVHGKNLLDKRYRTSGYPYLAADPTTGALLTVTPATQLALAGRCPAGNYPVGGYYPALGCEGTMTTFYGNPREVFLTVGFKL